MAARWPRRQRARLNLAGRPPASRPLIRPAGFAPGLIAAKPGKPCDGGVFGAFCPLLKKEWKRADTPAPPFTGPRLRAHGQPSIGPLPGFHGPDAVADLGAAARRPKDRKLQGKSLCRCLSASFPHPSFAPGLIAAKPEKPCDGGVFRAFYLLLKKERNAASRALVWLRMGLLRFKRGIAWAHRLGAPGGRIVWAANRAKPPSAKPPEPVQPSPAAPGFRCRPHSASFRRFRYRFDSNQARKNVR